MYFGRSPKIELGNQYPASSDGGLVYEETALDEEFAFRYFDPPGIATELGNETAPFGYTSEGYAAPGRATFGGGGGGGAYGVASAGGGGGMTMEASAGSTYGSSTITPFGGTSGGSGDPPPPPSGPKPTLDMDYSYSDFPGSDPPPPPGTAGAPPPPPGSADPEFGAITGLLAGPLPVRKVMRAVYNGLPRTTTRGFLDINSPFLSRFQQRYYSGFATDDSSPTVAKVGGTSLNFEFGGDADNDSTSFEDYYNLGYGRAAWSGLMRESIIIASRDIVGANRSEESDLGSLGSIPGVGGFESIIPDDSPIVGGFEFSPVNEIVFSDFVGFLDMGEWMSGGMPIFGSSMFNPVTGEYNLLKPKHFPAPTGGTTNVSDTGYDNVYKVSYTYGGFIVGTEVAADMTRRFKTENYVNVFSSELISDRISKINDRLGVVVDREADIKIQSNKAMSYLKSTSMAEDELYLLEERDVTRTSDSMIGGEMLDAERAVGGIAAAEAAAAGGPSGPSTDSVVGASVAPSSGAGDGAGYG